MKNIIISTTLLMVASSSAFAYDIIDLGANVEPKAINNYGVVVGSGNTDLAPSNAFRWTSANGMETLNGTSANAVNDDGLIAGSTMSGAFVLDGNSYRDWDGYGAFGVNQQGTVAGYEEGTNQYQPRSTPYNPATYDGNKWTAPDIAGIYSRGTRQGVYADRFILNGINADGFAVGYKYRYGLAGSVAILIDPNVTLNDLSDVSYLPTPAGGRAADINNKYLVVGTTGSSSATTPVTYPQAYVFDYSTSQVSILPLLAGGIRSNANDINEYDQVVGNSETLVGTSKVYHAVLWDQANGTTVDLNDYATAGWVFTAATAINDNGDIVGYGTYNGEPHGFVLSTGNITAPPVIATGTGTTTDQTVTVRIRGKGKKK
jgi:probable HAF family extracellular repeat protein